MLGGNPPVGGPRVPALIIAHVFSSAAHVTRPIITAREPRCHTTPPLGTLKPLPRKGTEGIRYRMTCHARVTRGDHRVHGRVQWAARARALSFVREPCPVSMFFCIGARRLCIHARDTSGQRQANVRDTSGQRQGHIRDTSGQRQANVRPRHGPPIATHYRDTPGDREGHARGP
jgi:hypothetical protein